MRSVGKFLWAFAAVGAITAAWSLATPLMAAPDEPSHAIAAAAAVRGQFYVLEQETGIGPISTVSVPKWVRLLAFLPNCDSFRPNVPEHCPVDIGTDRANVRVWTQFSKYPPFYYLVVGSPSLVMVGVNGAYAMRFAGDLLNAALTALGLFLLARYHPRRFTLVGAMVALTPMVFFVMSVINPSGMETSSAFAAWCGGLCLVAEPDPPRALVVLTTVAAMLLTLSRPISPVNALIVATVLAILAAKRRSVELIRDRRLRPLWFFAVTAGVLAVLLVVVFGAPALLGKPPTPRLDAWHEVLTTLKGTGSALRQTIGDFGWLDTPVPFAVVVVWTVAVASLVIYGLSVSGRVRRALPLLVLGVFAVRFIFETPRIDIVGAYWQGRYWLPLLVGIPLVAMADVPRMRHSRSMWMERRRVISGAGIVVGGGILIAAQVSAFLTALRRYQVGLNAPSGARVQWTPPGGDSLLITTLVCGELVLLGFVLWNSFQSAASQDRGERTAAVSEEPDPVAKSNSPDLATVPSGRSDAARGPAGRTSAHRLKST